MWGFMPPGSQGTVRVLGNIQGIPCVTGSGYLCEIHFHVIGQALDSSPLNLSGGLLFDCLTTSLISPVNWVNGSILVAEPLDITGYASPNPTKEGHIVNFVAAPTGGVPPYSYSWDFNDDGIEDSVLQNPSCTYPLHGIYNVCVTMTDSLDYTCQYCFDVTIDRTGDANRDYEVDMRDVTKVERIILLVDPPTPGADTNNDEVVDMRDVTKIERMILGYD
jgi:hypothetical protein